MAADVARSVSAGSGHERSDVEAVEDGSGEDAEGDDAGSAGERRSPSPLAEDWRSKKLEPNRVGQRLFRP